MYRKEFIKAVGVACLCGPALLTMLEGCETTSHLAQSTTAGNKLTIGKAEFVMTKNGKTSYRKYVLVKSDKLSFPVCLFRLADNEYAALLMRCTHKSCELKPEGDFLVCPCHGSEFTNRGIVQNPPAEQNLESYKTTTDNENIYIHI